jgi:hypothetical protein
MEELRSGRLRNQEGKKASGLLRVVLRRPS